MSAIFESETLGPTERLIMLSLADHADDDGRCYPSIARLVRRTGLSERAVQTNLKKLSDLGFIRIIMGGGKGNANLYFVSANPAADAPRTKCTPAADAPQTPQEVRPNPAADAPEPSGTTNEPSEEGSDDPLSSDDDLKTKAAASAIREAFSAYNAAAAESGWPQAQAMTPRRKSGIAARLRECGGISGWRLALSKAQASPMCCGQNNRGWIADLDFLIQAKSFTRLMEGSYDNRQPTGSPQRPPADDPALRAIAIAARMR